MGVVGMMLMLRERLMVLSSLGTTGSRRGNLGKVVRVNLRMTMIMWNMKMMVTKIVRTMMALKLMAMTSVAPFAE